MTLDKINLKEAFRYLGYGQNTPDGNVMSIAAECEKKLLEVIDARYVYRYFPIAGNTNYCGGTDGADACNTDGGDIACACNTDGGNIACACNMDGGDITCACNTDNGSEEAIRLEGTDICFTGRSIREHLKGCTGVVMFAATVSEGVDRLIRRLQVDKMTHAVIADSLASAAIEQVCDIAEREIMADFRGKYATWRFSPGYGDFPLELQRDFLNVLSAEKRIGVYVTEGGLMTPCKSVTAVIGISDGIIEQKRKGCVLCSFSGSCKYRQNGGHCGV